MPLSRIGIDSPPSLWEPLQSGKLREALDEVVRSAGAGLSVDEPGRVDPSIPDDQSLMVSLPLDYRGRQVGSLRYPDGEPLPSLRPTAHACQRLLEYAVDREFAVEDLAAEMLSSYEELNMLYALLPNIATRVHPSEVGKALVDETRRTLRCRRVSLLVLDEARQNLRVLASHGLPPDVQDLSIPLTGSISGCALAQDDCLIVNDPSVFPELMELSRGEYETHAFAVVRVPLHAQGEGVGVLTATERIDGTEFTARDRKLLEGLAAMGASALLNCRLHAAVNRQMVSTIRALASAIDAKDQYTHSHSARVAQLAVATVRTLGISDPETCREVELAGLLHDIGKIGISDAVLTKAGRLTPEEFKVVQKHAEIGAGIVQHVDGLEGVAQAVLHHHERYDGLGYPSGLAGESIPIISRLIAVADVFDCITSDRPYRKAIPTEQALHEITKSKGTQLDPAIVDAFLKVVRSEIVSSRKDLQPRPSRPLKPEPALAGAPSL